MSLIADYPEIAAVMAPYAESGLLSSLQLAAFVEDDQSRVIMIEFGSEDLGFVPTSSTVHNFWCATKPIFPLAVLHAASLGLWNLDSNLNECLPHPFASAPQ